MQTGLKNWEVQTGIHRTDFLADTGQTYVSGKALFVDAEKTEVVGVGGRAETQRSTTQYWTMRQARCRVAKQL